MDTGPADLFFAYGVSGDHPLVGDWDGDGDDTPAVVRNTGGAAQWFVRNSNSLGETDQALVYGLFQDTLCVWGVAT